MRYCKHPRGRGGFSLVEAALAIVIVAVGVVALVASLSAGSSINGAGRNLTRAVFLAQEVREWTVQLPFNDPNLGTTLASLYNVNGLTYSPPNDGEGQPINDMTAWSQKLTLTWRDPNSITSSVSPSASTVINVQASIRLQGKEVYSTNWFVAKRN